ncbi:hypothetical protein X977_4083 [Burkholderia pseudomallei MSHR7504]|nr:hypothetical protein X977_4083 [Burkholderia pseudomallei MSHR7504]
MSRAGFVVLGPGLVAPSPGAGARKPKDRELGRSATLESDARSPSFRGPRPEARGPRPEARGRRPEARGPRPKVRDPRSEIRDPSPSPSPSPSLEAHAKPSSPENPGDPKPLRIAETPASRQAAESNT